MTTIVIDDRQVPTLEIPDAEGELHSYTLSPAPPGLDEWACLVKRTDTGAVYRVALGPRGRWACSCHDYRYRSGKLPAACKHCQAVKGLRALMEALK